MAGACYLYQAGEGAAYPMGVADVAANEERAASSVAGRVVLAREAPERIGALLIDPPRRRVAHDDGREEILEPRVMQVLVALARASGEILTRDELLEACWGGVVVGEDALSRVIGRLRRLSEGVAADVFELETITKVGYRLVTPGDRARFEPPPTASAAPGERPALSLPSKPSIAVLPFKNISGDPGKEYLADAITEDIVTALSHWRWFFVIARNSSFAYKNSDVDAARVGQELGVRYVLVGSVAAAGSRVRVSARLVDAVTGSNVWADKFDHELVDVFTLQDQMTERVVAAIEPAMLHGEGVRIERKSPADFNALDCFYRGMWSLNQMTDEADADALALFREAIRLDPALALGHIGASRIHYWRSICGVSDAPEDELCLSLALARTAIGLDSREATAYFASAGAELYLGDHAAALEDARRAVNLNSNFAYGHYRLGQVQIFAGAPTNAIEHVAKSLRLSPYDPQQGPMLETLALAHYQAGDYENAAVHAASAGRVSGAGRSVLAAALAQLGRADEAARVLTRVEPARPSQQRPLAAPYANPAHLEHLKQGVRLAGAVRFE